MFLFFTTIFLAILLPSSSATQWRCVFCYYPYNPRPYPYPYSYPYPYPYFYPNFYPPYVINPTTPAPPNRSIGPCVNGQCPVGYGCYRSQCIAVSNNYGPCINNQCPMGFCYNGQCVG